jgi:hypothetical protein
MALTFPSSPVDGQLYIDSGTGNRYIYDSAKGLWKYASNNVSMTVGAAPPPTTTVAPGAMWYNTNTGRTFILYDDGDSRQWVENVPAVGSFDSSTVAGYANAAAVIAVAPAFNKANSALQNTSGTFAGSLTATGDVTSGGTLTALSTVQSSSGADLSLNANGANRDVIVKVNSSELARVVGSTGRVGIGNISPQAKLHVGGSGGANFLVADNDDANRGVRIDSNFASGQTYVGTNTSAKHLILGIDGIEKLRLEAGGHVKLASGIKILNSSGNPILQQTGSILQVVTAFDSGTSTTNSGWTTTGLTASITPTSSTSKILVLLSWTGRSGSNRMGHRIDRSGTVIEGQLESLGVLNNPQRMFTHYLDSPATTSSRSYTLQIYQPNTSGAIQTNDAGSNVGLNSHNEITLIEIAA